MGILVPSHKVTGSRGPGPIHSFILFFGGSSFFWGNPIFFSPLSLSRESSPPYNPVYVSHVDLPVLASSLSLHRHPHICLLFRVFSIHKKQTTFHLPKSSSSLVSYLSHHWLPLSLSVDKQNKHNRGIPFPPMGLLRRDVVRHVWLTH